jgi:hypothetical protein
MTDTLLVQACENFIEAYQRLIALAKMEDPAAFDRPAFEQADMAVDSLAEKIAAMTPTTASGIRAKARAADVLWTRQELNHCSREGAGFLARSLLIDLAGLRDNASVQRVDRRGAFAAVRDGADRCCNSIGHYLGVAREMFLANLRDRALRWDGMSPP